LFALRILADLERIVCLKAPCHRVMDRLHEGLPGSEHKD
jgi:hypothetical protein